MVQIDIDESLVLDALTPKEILEYFDTNEILAAMEENDIVDFLLDRGIDFMKGVEPESIIIALGKEAILDSIEPEDVIAHYGDEEILDIILSNRKR